jgi:hypothetical protein
MTPRPGQDDLEVPASAIIAVTFIAIHALHLWLIGRTIERTSE